MRSTYSRDHPDWRPGRVVHGARPIAERVAGQQPELLQVDLRAEHRAVGRAAGQGNRLLPRRIGGAEAG